VCTSFDKLPCGTKFLRVLIFAGLFAIRKNKLPQNKITANIFPAKINSTIEYIYKNTSVEGENAIDNSVENTSSGTLVIIDPLECRVTLINLSFIPMLFYLHSDQSRTQSPLAF